MVRWPGLKEPGREPQQCKLGCLRAADFLAFKNTVYPKSISQSTWPGLCKESRSAHVCPFLPPPPRPRPLLRLALGGSARCVPRTSPSWSFYPLLRTPPTSRAAQARTRTGPPPCPCPCPSLSFSRFCLRNPGTAGPTRTVPRALRGEQVSGASPHFLRLGGEADSVPRIPAASPCPGNGSRRAPPGRARAATSLTSQSPAAGHGRPPGATPPGSLCGPRGGGRGRGRRSGWRCRGADVRIGTLPARAAPSKQRERREQRPGTGRAQAGGGRGRGGRRT